MKPAKLFEKLIDADIEATEMRLRLKRILKIINIVGERTHSTRSNLKHIKTTEIEEIYALACGKEND